MRVKSLIEGLGGIKEILIFNKIDNFINQFKKSNLRLTSAKNNSIIGSLPRYIIEVVLVSILVITSLVVSLLEQSYFKQFNAIVFSATFIRLTPSAYRIISSLQRIKFTQKI